LDDRLKDGLVSRIINTISKREVDSIVLASAYANIPKLTSTGEVLAVLVERDSHDPVGSIERFLNTIAVVNVNVNVENSLLEAEKLNNAKDDI
jgi:hypothetical protein